MNLKTSIGLFAVVVIASTAVMFFKMDPVKLEVEKPEIIEFVKPAPEIKHRAEVRMVMDKAGKKVEKRVYVLEETPTHKVYPVYFGTDRLKAPGPVVETRPNTKLFLSALIVAWIATGVLLMVLRRDLGETGRRIASGVCVLLLAVSIGLTIWAMVQPVVVSLEPELPRAFTEYRGEMLQVGVCPVSVPIRHKPGEIDAPTKYERRLDPAKHIVLQRVERMTPAEFDKDFRAAVENASDREALVFVHGYNVSFEDAAKRTAQLVHDLKFPGIGTFYSWPSNGHTLAYTWDEQSVTTAVNYLKEFLETLAAKGDLKAIHVIAHSMGSRCATKAILKGLKLEKCRLDQFILAAPDMDAIEFKDLAPELVKSVGRLTLYASSKDKALRFSHGVHDYPRTGDAGPGIMVVDGIESIDASHVETDDLGHSYYGDSPRLLQDINLVILERCPASDKRRGLRPVPITAISKYWQFPP